MPGFWPWIRRTTYAALGAPAIKAVDLNALQDENIEVERVLRGSRVYLKDDFLGSAISASHWVQVGTMNAADDHGADGFGSLALFVSAGSDHDQHINTQNLPVGLRDFYYGVRVRPATVGATGVNDFGFTDQSFGGNSCTFECDVASGKWLVRFPTNGSLVTGVAYANQYFFLECYRIGGQLYFDIDGVNVKQLADATNLTNVQYMLRVTYVAHTQDFVLDLAELWVAR